MKRSMKKCGTGVSPVSSSVLHRRLTTSDRRLFHSSAVVYISGAMRNRPKFNFPAFFSMEELLVARFGCRVLNPVRITDPHVFRYHRKLKGAKLQRAYAKHDLDMLFNASAIVLLDGWRDSIGAMAEYHTAVWLNLDIVHESELRK